jgi:hypothetical protein
MFVQDINFFWPIVTRSPVSSFLISLLAKPRNSTLLLQTKEENYFLYASFRTTKGIKVSRNRNPPSYAKHTSPFDGTQKQFTDPPFHLTHRPSKHRTQQYRTADNTKLIDLAKLPGAGKSTNGDERGGTGTCASTTLPKRPKASWSLRSSVCHDRPPTKIRPSSFPSIAAARPEKGRSKD